MEDAARERSLREKRRRLDRMMKALRGGVVCEMGCGSGFVLEYLSLKLRCGMVIGLDRSLERLEAAASKGLPNAAVVAADLRVRVLGKERFDSVVFVWSLHEVFSRAGDAGVRSTLEVAAEILKPEGVIVIQDFLKPPPRQVVLRFKNDVTRASFERFAREFEPRKVDFDVVDEGVRLDAADAVEFLSKYRHTEEDEWRDEMAETHFFYTLEDHKARTAEVGLNIVSAEPQTLSWQVLKMAEEDMDFDFRPHFRWTQMVLEKS